MAKNILDFGDSRSKLLEGVSTIADIVGTTLGPGGSNVVFRKTMGHHDPIITKDGVSVAREVTLEDPHMDLGCEIVKKACEEQLKKVGDGTTTTAVLTKAIFYEGSAVIDGVNPHLFNKELNYFCDKIVAHLKSRKKDCKTEEDLFAVAKIATNGDEKIAKLIAKAVFNSGEYGAIIVNKRAKEFEVETLNSYLNNKGLFDHKMYDVLKGNNDQRQPICNVNPKKQEIDDKANLIMFREKVENFNDLRTFIEFSNMVDKRILVIVAPEFSEDVKSMALSMATKNHDGVVLVDGPSYGVYQETYMEDLACAVGVQIMQNTKEARLFTPANIDPAVAKTMSHDEVREAMSNKFRSNVAKVYCPLERVIIGRDMSCFFPTDSYVDQEAKNHRLDSLKSEVELSNEYDQTLLKERISCIEGKTSILHFYGRTETEAKEIADRVDDAIKSCLAAYKQGVIAGGGISLLHSTKVLRRLASNDLSSWTQEKIEAINVIEKSLFAPCIKILKNYGFSDGAINTITSETLKYKYPKGYNFNETGDEYVSYLTNKVLDPVLVTTTALQTAVSLAGNLLTTNVSMVNNPKY
jgi:chaperonin GroEL